MTNKNTQFSKFCFCVWVCVCVHVCTGLSVLSHSWLFATPWTVVHHAPLSMGFPRQEHWSRLPFPSPGKSSWPGIKPASSALAGGFFTNAPLEKALFSLLSPNLWDRFHNPILQQYQGGKTRTQELRWALEQDHGGLAHTTSHPRKDSRTPGWCINTSGGVLGSTRKHFRIARGRRPRLSLLLGCHIVGCSAGPGVVVRDGVSVWPGDHCLLSRRTPISSGICPGSGKERLHRGERETFLGHRPLPSVRPLLLHRPSPSLDVEGPEVSPTYEHCLLFLSREVVFLKFELETVELKGGRLLRFPLLQLPLTVAVDTYLGQGGGGGVEVCVL